VLATNLPAGVHGNLCAGRSSIGKLLMPTTLTGQNGAQVTQSTRIAVTGCPRQAKAKAKPKGKGKKAKGARKSGHKKR
jgi:hypothetical protein